MSDDLEFWVQIDMVESELTEALDTIKDLYAALEDMLSGWNYIRLHHGDLPGVGWDRAEDAASAALARARGDA